jgi:CYTH domain-containing protein
MAIEIERKFLVHPKLWNDLTKPEGLYCQQTYLLKDEDRTVRVRVIGNKGFITFKGKTVGFSKPEFEYEIPASEAKEMMLLFGEITIEKTRFLFPQDNQTWEVDVFYGDNEGLIVAEIELKSESETFSQPDWIAKEVTGDYRYSNSNLQSNPYINWK